MSMYETFSDRIAKLDLNPIKFKLMSEDGKNWNREKADRVELAYRQFLDLVLENGDAVIVPSKEVDAFWHAHILDTRKYAKDCNRIFGCFLHHFPYLGSRGEADKAALARLFEESNSLLEARFGQQSVTGGLIHENAVCGGSCGGDRGNGNDFGLSHGIDLETRPSLQSISH